MFNFFNKVRKKQNKKFPPRLPSTSYLPPIKFPSDSPSPQEMGPGE